MPLVRWSDNYRIGHEQIDHDHQQLFALINNFSDAVEHGVRRRDIQSLLSQLVSYAEAHFQREEEIMAASGYPEVVEHHAAHTGLYETIYALNKRLETDPAPLDRAAIAFLKHWLTDHVIADDLKLGAFLAQKKGT
ncbi:MAG: hemerythrin-like metal-binding protein [Burkholderiaceae bacterium]|nr:hemerythrin-like metal-binding protein [Burkholderiaceae bacterium]